MRSTNNDSKTHLSTLPEELLLLIFSDLDAKDLLSLMKVCKYTKVLANNNRLWFNLYKNQSGNITFFENENYKLRWFIDLRADIKPLKDFWSDNPPIAKSQEAGFEKLVKASLKNLALAKDPHLVLFGLVTFQIKFLEQQWRRAKESNPDAFQDEYTYQPSRLCKTLQACQDGINRGRNYSTLNALEEFNEFVKNLPVEDVYGESRDYYADRASLINEVNSVVIGEFLRIRSLMNRW